MTGDLLKAHVLSSKLMTDIEDIMIEEFGLPEGHIDIGLFTTDNEDIGYVAADEATKKANVRVCYAKSTYGGTWLCLRWRNDRHYLRAIYQRC